MQVPVRQGLVDACQPQLVAHFQTASPQQRITLKAAGKARLVFAFLREERKDRILVAVKLSGEKVTASLNLAKVRNHASECDGTHPRSATCRRRIDQCRRLLDDAACIRGPRAACEVVRHIPRHSISQTSPCSETAYSVLVPQLFSRIDTESIVVLHRVVLFIVPLRPAIAGRTAGDLSLRNLPPLCADDIYCVRWANREESDEDADSSASSRQHVAATRL